MANIFPPSPPVTKSGYFSRHPCHAPSAVEAASALHRALDRQLVTISKNKYLAEAFLEPSRGVAAAEADGRWQQVFGGGATRGAQGGDVNLVAVVKRLWGGPGTGLPTRGPGERPDTLILRGLPAKWFEVDIGLIGSDDEDEDEDEDEDDEVEVEDEEDGKGGSKTKRKNNKQERRNKAAEAARAAARAAREEKATANLKTLRWALSRFGTVRSLEVVSSSSTAAAAAGGSGGPNGGQGIGIGLGDGRLLGGGLGLGGLNVDAVGLSLTCGPGITCHFFALYVRPN